MKKTFLTTLFLIALFANLSFAEKPVIAVSIPPQEYFIEKLMGDKVEVFSMVQPGMDPHTFSPTPQDMMKLNTVDAYFAIGIDFEQNWLHRFKSVNSQMKVIKQDQLNSHTPHQHHHGHDHDHSLCTDPHVWLSPKEVLRVNAFYAEELKKLFPPSAPTIEESKRLFDQEIKELQKEIASLFSDKTRNTFFINHSSWKLYADEFGLIEESIYKEGKEPSPRDYQSLIDRLKKEGAHIIFLSPHHSSRAVKQLQESFDIEIQVIDQLAKNWRDNLLEVSQKIADSLT